MSTVKGANPGMNNLIDLFDPSRNKTILELWEKDSNFGTNKSRDNYVENKKDNEKDSK